MYRFDHNCALAKIDICLFVSIFSRGCYYLASYATSEFFPQRAPSRYEKLAHANGFPAVTLSKFIALPRASNPPFARSKLRNDKKRARYHFIPSRGAGEGGRGKEDGESARGDFSWASDRVTDGERSMRGDLCD